MMIEVLCPTVVVIPWRFLSSDFKKHFWPQPFGFPGMVRSSRRRDSDIFFAPYLVALFLFLERSIQLQHRQPDLDDVRKGAS